MNNMNMITHKSRKCILKGKMINKSSEKKYELGVAKSFISKVKYFFYKKLGHLKN